MSHFERRGDVPLPPPSAVILKTDPNNVAGVIKWAKHATDEVPRWLEIDALILIYEVATGKTTPPRVTHTMLCDKIYEDTEGESHRIWGRSWRHIIQGRDLARLARPILLGELNRASGLNYGQGAQKYVYLDDRDLQLLRSEGRLR